MKIGIAFLVYGDEHIDEYNDFVKNLEKYHDLIDIHIITDCKEKIVNQSVTIIETSEPFNFNLKRIAIKSALKNNDVVIAMDTDLFIQNIHIDFSLLENLDDGFYPKWVNSTADFNNEIINVYDTEYGIKLQSYTNEKLLFLDECIFIIKLTDVNDKTNFINNWEMLYKETMDIQPKSTGPGAMEGLIIYLTCIMCSIELYSMDVLKKFFDNFYHYAYNINKNNIRLANKKKKMI